MPFIWKSENLIKALIDPLILKNEKMVKDILNESADLLLGAVQKRAPYKTGKYRKSWKKTKVSGNKIKILTPEKELFAILEKTGSKGAHIVPKNAKALHWVDETTGEDVFVMWSNPKGFKNMPHLVPAMKAFRKIFPHVIFKHVGRTAKGWETPTSKSVKKVQTFKSKNHI